MADHLPQPPTTFPLSPADARIAAREDEYLDYLACLAIAAATPAE